MLLVEQNTQQSLNLSTFGQLQVFLLNAACCIEKFLRSRLGKVVVHGYQREQLDSSLATCPVSKTMVVGVPVRSPTSSAVGFLPTFIVLDTFLSMEQSSKQLVLLVTPHRDATIAPVSMSSLVHGPQLGKILTSLPQLPAEHLLAPWKLVNKKDASDQFHLAFSTLCRWSVWCLQQQSLEKSFASSLM